MTHYFTMMTDEVFDCISDDPEFINKRIREKPPLCMVANKNLNPLEIHKMVETSYVFVNEYEGEEHLVVAGGFYKKPQKFFDKIDAELMAKCNAAKKWVNGGKRDTPVLDGRLEDPLCILISEALEPIRLDMFKKSWKIKGSMRDAIACVMYDPDYDPGPGKVISQGPMILTTQAE